MRIETLVLVGLVLWAWSGVPVVAQSTPKLQFVKKNDISIVVESLNEDDRACGITKTGLDAAVRLPLSRNGFFVKQTIGSDYLYVNVTAISHVGRRSCSVSFDLSYKRGVSLITNLNELDRFKWDPSNPQVMPELLSNYYIAGATVWSRGTLLTGPSENMSKRVKDELEGFTEEWIAKWLIDNPQ